MRISRRARMIGPSMLGSLEDARYKFPHVQTPHMYSLTDTQRETVAANDSHVLFGANVMNSMPGVMSSAITSTPNDPSHHVRFGNTKLQNEEAGTWVI